MITRATRGQREIWYMESGPSRVNAPLEGPAIPRSRRYLFKDQSFANIYNAYTRADKWPAGDAAGKVGGGEGRWSAPGMVQCRGARRWGTVVGVCLVPRVGTGDGL